jgi:tetratricopeptide (TPR) repeat protein
MRKDMADDYRNRANVRAMQGDHAAAIADYDAAIKLMEGLRGLLEPQGRWEAGLRNDLAGAYLNRGNAKQHAIGQGPAAAIADYDNAIALIEDPRGRLEHQGGWEAGLRNDLAKAYVNRGNAKQSAGGHGPAAALADYDAAIEIREALRRLLEPDGRGEVGLRNDLAVAYLNLGLARRLDGDLPAAVADWGRAATLLVGLID